MFFRSFFGLFSTSIFSFFLHQMAFAGLKFGESSLDRVSFGGCVDLTQVIRPKVSIFSPSALAITPIQVSVFSKNEMQYLKYACPDSSHCQSVLSDVERCVEVSQNSLRIESRSETELVFVLPSAINRSDSNIKSLFELPSLNTPTMRGLFHAGIKSVNVSDLELSTLALLLVDKDSPQEMVPGYSYQSGGFANRTVSVAEEKRHIFIRQKLKGRWEYFSVIDQVDKFYIVANFDGKNVSFQKIEKNSGEMVRTTFKDYQDKVYAIQLRVKRAAVDPMNYHNNLIPFKAGDYIGSDDSMGMFQLKATAAEHNLSDYSVQIFLGLLSLPSELSFERALSESARIRKRATSNKTGFQGADEVGELRTSLSVTHIPSQVAKDDSRQLLSRNDAEFVERQYSLQGKNILIKRLVYGGIELTGYDLEHEEFVHPTTQHMESGLTMLGQIYNKIQHTDYSSLLDLQQDVALFHWWGIQTLPFKRGTAGTIDLIVKYLFFSKGFLPSPWKDGVMPDIKAFTMLPTDYVRAYPEFFQN